MPLSSYISYPSLRFKNDYIIVTFSDYETVPDGGDWLLLLLFEKVSAEVFNFLNHRNYSFPDQKSNSTLLKEKFCSLVRLLEV